MSPSRTRPWQGLALWLGLQSLAGIAHAEEAERLQSANYQLIRLASSLPASGRWDAQHKATVIDLRSLRPMLEANPDISASVRQLIAKLTQDYSQPFELRDTLKRDDVVYFSDYWTRKDSSLNIIEYHKAGSTKDLTAYLGPLANLPTGSYGRARFALHYRGETLEFWGLAQQEGWSLRPRYWTHAQLLLPSDSRSTARIAVITLHLPTNYLDGDATLLLLPRTP